MLIFGLPAAGQTVRVSVFSLFHPAELTVRAGSARVTVHTESGSVVLEGVRNAVLRWPERGSVEGPAEFILGVPGKIERAYRGSLRIEPVGRELVAVVGLDLEDAVASVTAAELPEAVPLEAQKAQAVAARSYLQASKPRHRGFDFCDTTHCQFLRALPGPGSRARRAAEQTRGIVLTYGGVPFPALYSAACGGRTLERAQSPYSYRAVECARCRRHPGDPARGHRMGLCQEGASGMAQAGASFREILDHYYPGAAFRKSASF